MKEDIHSRVNVGDIYTDPKEGDVWSITKVVGERITAICIVGGINYRKGQVNEHFNINYYVWVVTNKSNNFKSLYERLGS